MKVARTVQARPKTKWLGENSEPVFQFQAATLQLTEGNPIDALIDNGKVTFNFPTQGPDTTVESFTVDLLGAEEGDYDVMLVRVEGEDAINETGGSLAAIGFTVDEDIFVATHDIGVKYATLQATNGISTVSLENPSQTFQTSGLWTLKAVIEDAEGNSHEFTFELNIAPEVDQVHTTKDVAKKRWRYNFRRFFLGQNRKTLTLTEIDENSSQILKKIGCSTLLLNEHTLTFERCHKHD